MKFLWSCHLAVYQPVCSEPAFYQTDRGIKAQRELSAYEIHENQQLGQRWRSKWVPLLRERWAGRSSFTHRLLMSVITCAVLDSPEQMLLLPQRDQGLTVAVGSGAGKGRRAKGSRTHCTKAGLIRSFNGKPPPIHKTVQLLQSLKALRGVDLFLMEKADRQSLPLHSRTRIRAAELPLLAQHSETQSRFQGSGDNRLDLWNHRKDIKR